MYLLLKKATMIILTVTLLAVVGLILLDNKKILNRNQNLPQTIETIDGLWKFTFNEPGILHETGNSEESTSPYFWLTAGGELIISDGVGKTIHGALESEDQWNKLYKKYSALDTDEGRYPQNIFRLVTKKSARDAEISVSFKINSINFTKTPNRGAWSGVFIMSRYKDSDNLYYSGIRQDGHAVIKKKIDGTYYTLAEKPIFLNEHVYDPDVNPNFLPGKKWMILKTNLVNRSNGVEIKLYIDKLDGAGSILLLDTYDDGVGGPAHSEAGRFGLRSDYMDMEFDDLTAQNLN